MPPAVHRRTPLLILAMIIAIILTPLATLPTASTAYAVSAQASPASGIASFVASPGVDLAVAGSSARNTGPDAVLASVNLQISISGVPSAVTPGQNVSATINVRNAGATPATDVQIAGIVPQRTTHVSGGTPDTTIYTGYTYTTFPVIASLAPSASVELLHTFQIPANATTGTRFNYEDVSYRATADGVTRRGFQSLNTIMTLEGGTPPPPTFNTRDVKITVSTVNPITTGGNYPITVEIRNAGTVAGTAVRFSFPIPAGTTFVSGGTFIADYKFGSTSYGPHTQATLTLEPGQTQTFVYTVAVPSNPPVGTAYPIARISLEYDLPGGITRFGGIFANASMLVEAPATVVASYRYNGVQFQTPLHGFGFNNYNNGTRNWQDDLLPADVFSLFGPGACQSGTTAETCVLTTAAEQWRTTTLNGADDGHCEGMAVASIRLFENRPFKGKTTPTEFGSPSGNTVDLNLTPEMENYIMYYFASQYASEVANAHYFNRKKPSEIVQALIAGFNSGSAVGYTIGIYKPRTFAEGHAIIAVGVEQLQAEQHKYRIIVYDNNYPKQRKYIEVDTQAETWRYSTAASPGNDASAYTGTVDSKNLEYAPITIRELQAGQYYKCRFCNQPSLAAEPTPAGVTITYMGEGDLLVVDPASDARIGYDFATGTYTDTFATKGITATVEYLKIDPTVSAPPRYTLPVIEGLYEVYIGASEGISVTNGYLMVEGDGFVMGFDAIDLPDDGSTYRFQISPEGELIGIDVDAAMNEDVLLPSMYLAYDPIDATEPSVAFQMDGVSLAGGELATIRLDRATQRFYFETTDPYENFFDLQLEMVNPDGTTFEDTTTVFTPSNLGQFYVSYDGWDGGKLPVTLTQRMYTVFLPLAVR